MWTLWSSLLPLYSWRRPGSAVCSDSSRCARPWSPPTPGHSSAWKQSSAPAASCPSSSPALSGGSVPRPGPGDLEQAGPVQRGPGLKRPPAVPACARPSGPDAGRWHRGKRCAGRCAQREENKTQVPRAQGQVRRIALRAARLPDLCEGPGERSQKSGIRTVCLSASSAGIHAWLLRHPHFRSAPKASP